MEMAIYLTKFVGIKSSECIANCSQQQKLLVNGYEGGKEAAASLTKQLHQDLGNTSINLWTCVYYNHSGLKKVLSKAQIVSEVVFDEFCDGFRSASQLIHMMDVG